MLKSFDQAAKRGREHFNKFSLRKFNVSIYHRFLTSALEIERTYYANELVISAKTFRFPFLYIVYLHRSQESVTVIRPKTFRSQSLRFSRVYSHERNSLPVEESARALRAALGKCVSVRVRLFFCDIVRREV